MMGNRPWPGWGAVARNSPSLIQPGRRLILVWGLVLKMFYFEIIVQSHKKQHRNTHPGTPNSDVEHKWSPDQPGH